MSTPLSPKIKHKKKSISMQRVHHLLFTNRFVSKHCVSVLKSTDFFYHKMSNTSKVTGTKQLLQIFVFVKTFWISCMSKCNESLDTSITKVSHWSQHQDSFYFQCHDYSLPPTKHFSVLHNCSRKTYIPLLSTLLSCLLIL